MSINKYTWRQEQQMLEDSFARALLIEYNIREVTTQRQARNGTIVWRLPMKGRGNTHIEYASFSTGYVRNQGNQCHSNWQCNKRVKSEPQYYPDYKWCDKTNQSIATGKFNRYYSRICVLIPTEIERLEYMMKYIVKFVILQKFEIILTIYISTNNFSFKTN